jgi:exopolysaccharide biosynthesis operon protein EpsL
MRSASPVHLMFAALAAAPALAADLPRDDGDAFRLQLSHSMTQDSNLYRLPDNIDVSDISPTSTGSRDDLVSHTSASADGSWDIGKQSFALNVNVDANRYADNDSLDNTSGNGRADWNWQLGKRWSGQLGGGYGRALSSFVNSRFLARDVLESSDYHGAARYRLTPHWSLAARARLAEGSHDTVARQQDNFESQATAFGVDYLTGRGDELGVEYRRTSTDFPNETRGSQLFASRRYIDRTANFNLRYAFTVKTSLQGSVGYTWRHYPEGVIGDFAGATWNAALLWEPRAKTRVTVGQWQELKAYLDSESSHFESRGTRVTVAWLPTARISLSVEVSDERHDYEGFDADAFGDPPRRDELRAARAALTWRPRQMLALEVAYGVERRDSSRPLYDFDDRTASAGIRMIL